MRGGVKCPHCGSDDLARSEVEIDESGAGQLVGCIACHAEWTDRYQLVGVIQEIDESV